MIEIEMPDEAGMTAARRHFAALSESRNLLQGGAAPGISAGRLYAHAMAPAPSPDAALETALERNLALRRTYRDFVAAGATYRLGEVIAASTDDIPPRRGAGCRISVRASQSEADQFIVILELADGAASPAALVLCDRDDRCHRFALPGAHRGVIQFIVQADDPILPLLRDPGTEALLR
jgi:hypothetical protein